jgi:hypothetical protein
MRACSRRRVRRWLVVAGLALGAAGCSGDKVACPGTCECREGDTCAFDCGANGCAQVDCLGATCTADCAGGSCVLDCDAASVCSFDCPGGGCSYDCDSASTCTHTCAGGGCTVLCDAASTCTLDCTGAAEPCSLLCENGGQATCVGNCSVESC